MSESPEVVGHLPEIAKLFQQADDFLSDLADFGKRLDVLSKDVGACNAPLRKTLKSQFWRRTIIRNLFALIEGHVFGMKQIALKHFESQRGRFFISRAGDAP